MIAIGSSDELINHLRIIAITIPHLEQEASALATEYQILSKRLNSMHKKW